MEVKLRQALVKDVPKIFELCNKNATKGLMLTRSKYKIITMLANFYVAENSDGEVLACAALSPLWTDMAEVMALAVDDTVQGKGIGSKLVSYLVERAATLGFPKVIALTYQVDFFKKLGFKITNKDNFPRKMWRECLECPKLEACDETAVYIDLQS